MVAAAVGAAAGADARPGVIRRTSLAGGPVVVTDEMPGSRSATLGIWVGVGSRDEPAGLHGVTHFLEHLLFKGTAHRSPRDIARAIEGVGGDVNAYTAREHMVLHGRVPARHAAGALELLCDVIAAPRLDPDDVELERHVILDELAGAAELPEDEAHRVGHEQLFPGHGLGRETLGSEASIRAVTAADVQSWFGSCFSSAPMVVAAAGGLRHDDVVALVQERLGDGRAGRWRPSRECPPPPAATALELVRAAEQAHLLMAWRGPAGGDPARWPMAVLTQILGGGMASRLFQEIREERGLVYGIDAAQSAYTDAGVLEIGAASAPEDLGQVVDLVHAEVADVAGRGPTADELETAVGFLTGALELAEEDSAARMIGLGAAVWDRDEVPDLEADLAAIRAVTVDDVGTLAAALFAVDPVTVAVRPPPRS